jgi:hypothetical protein
MYQSSVDYPASCPFSKRLIMVLEQDVQIGTRFVQLIRQATACQAILARNLSEVRTILEHLQCDLVLLTDDPFPDEDLKRLYLLLEGSELPELLSLTFLSWTYNYRNGRDMRNVVKAVNLLLAVRDGAGPSLPGSDGKHE